MTPRRSNRRGPGQREIAGEDLNLAAEVAYIQRQAAKRVGRIVTIGPVLLFSTETGDAWLLDPADQLATRVAQDGDPFTVHIEETADTFAIGWQGRYAIGEDTFTFHDAASPRVTTILGYPLGQLRDQVSRMTRSDWRRQS
jgi:hypothetical protein